ncbi:outer membrane beta-barrel protein, partial [Arthrospira platensis SPKY1]|nr:outer membrane beta-barrel protein [Arthrospira platensis SPKY1]
KNHFFNVGVRGELLPKVDGFFRIGYTRQSSSRDISNQDTLGLNTELSWAATPKTVVRLMGSRDFGVAGEGNVTENTRVSTSVVYSVTPLLSINGRLGWALRDYKNNAGGN